MLLTMGVTLYTTRIVLNTLGEEDFGIYNVVGGFVAMLGLLNSGMAIATQRFLSFELGQGNYNQLRNVFSMSLNIHFIIALTILILAESAGLWFVNTQLNIPINRLTAAKWVYQFSIFTFLVNMVSVPYNAIIIAYERMNIFALVSIVEVSLKLLIVFMLTWFGFDKLELYAVLILAVAVIIRAIYGLYCKRNFSESHFRLIWDKTLFKTLLNYAGWNLWGNAASLIYGQGVNILLNIFFGPIVNAARGIAFQVKSAINGFVSNFQMAMNPQIVKSFAKNDIIHMHQLIFLGARYSFFLLLLFSIPILLETKTILTLWLKNVPDYTDIFTKLALVNVLIDSISGPLVTAAQATGKIKLYQSVVGGLLLLILPISYVFLEIGFPPQITLYVSITISILALFARLLILKPLIKISITKFIKEVIIPSFNVGLAALFIPVFVHFYLKQGFIRLFSVSIVAFICTAISIYFIGINANEKLFLRNRFNNFFK